MSLVFGFLSRSNSGLNKLSLIKAIWHRQRKDMTQVSGIFLSLLGSVSAYKFHSLSKMEIRIAVMERNNSKPLCFTAERWETIS